MMITRSLPWAMPWRSAMRLALSTISSKLVDVAGVDRVDAPQQRPAAAPSVSDALIARIGTVGRSRAIRRAVEPELV